MAFGLPIGGLLVGAAGWRITFIIDIPFAVLAFVLAWTGIPKDTPPRTRAHHPRQIASAIDLIGIVLFGGMFSALLVFLLHLDHPDWVVLAIAAGPCADACRLGAPDSRSAC